MSNWKWNGARWWKVDFHAHTPASEDYGKGPDQATLRLRSPREWLLDFMHAKIDCVAVTDHNSGAWVDQLKHAYEALRLERPEGYRDIHLFPGVEISVNGGIHVLAMFGSSATSSDIDTLLGAVGFTGNKGRSDSVTTKSFSEVVAEVHNANGIVIPAHGDGFSGLLATVEGVTLRQAIECRQVIAIEIVDQSWEKPALYTDLHLDWTEVLGSDSHHPSTGAGGHFPGSHFTWVKMAQPSLEGVRLALLDGVLSVKRSDAQSDDPNGHASLVIEAIEVSQARYMGRSRPFLLELNPWLNSVIGGRGTGKSTIVEFLRAALRREDELPPSLKGDFEKYWSVYANRNDDGLLTRDSQLSVIYRKDGVRYRIRWDSARTLNPIEVEDGDGGWNPEQGEVVQRFPARIYSQKQIFELAKDPLALLRIVDEAPSVERSTWDERWRQEESRFLLLQAKSRDVEAGLIDEARLRGELEDVKRKLEVFEGSDHASVLKTYQSRNRQSGLVERWEATWSSVGDSLRNSSQELVPSALDQSAFDDADDVDRDLIERSTTPIQGLERIREKLQELAGEGDALFRSWTEARDASRWKESVHSAVEAYEELCRKLEDEGAGDPSAYRELVKRRQEIESRLLEFQKRREELASIQKESGECLAGLLKLRQEITHRRKKFMDSVLAGNAYVRIKVAPYGARETVEPEIRRLLQRDGGFEKDIGTTEGGDSLLGKLYQANPDARTFESNLSQLKETIRSIASGRYEKFELKDQRFGAHVAKLPPEILDRLDVWFPEDTLQVEYSTSGDGAAFRSIQEGSPGQKTAALLAFLLSYGDEPIVLDQPEDDLDNQLIYNLIVKQLRSIKQRRQILVVTHNANIVVNGDSELVVALSARHGETHHEAEGSLQQKSVRDTICDVMEGGREAFEQRYRRISLQGQAASTAVQIRSTGR